MIWILFGITIAAYLYCLHRLTSAERRRQYKLWADAEALRRENLAAKRFNDAQQHRDASGEWKDWA